MAAAQVRTRSYRELLTPALHRRFTRAAGVILIVCYIEAVIIGNKSSCKDPFILFNLHKTNSSPQSTMVVVPVRTSGDTCWPTFYFVSLDLCLAGGSVTLWESIDSITFRDI